MTSVLTLLAVAALTGLDQYLKYLVDLHLKVRETLPLIPGVLQLHYSENDGAMMGLLPGKTVLMSVLAFVMLAIMVYIIFSGKIRSRVLYCALVGVFAGGLGNIIDRIFRGYVIDYIEVLFVRFYIFNFADCLITVGGFTILFYELYVIWHERREREAPVHG